VADGQQAEAAVAQAAVAGAAVAPWPPGTVVVVGIDGDRLDRLSPEARAAVGSADVLVGGRRHLATWRGWAPSSGPAPVTIEIGADVDQLAREVRRRAVDAGERVCVLASGDPGFFGITRALGRTVDRRSLRVLPAVSSVSAAFAELGLPWDDAAVVSAHGRALAEAVGAIRGWHKVAVLTSPESPPEAIGKALLDAGVAFDLVAVCSRLGSAGEQVTEIDLLGLAAGSWDPLSVLVLVGPGGLPMVGWGTAAAASDDAAVLAWGLPDSAFAHRAGMITKAEVRSVVLGKLALPATGVLWDVGAGSGSVAIESSLARPGLTVLAVEESADAAAQISANVAALGAGVHVVPGHAPEVLEGLPAPDRAFVGGGGAPALRAVVDRLRPGGRVVATFAALDRAAAAAELLGNLVQIAVAQGERFPDGGWHLAARNPVFVAWGPGGE
jgi:precorrin-6Y C5,15-methyltransferase (decarboxylating)